MGPFSHGGWSHEMGKHFHNEVYFGDSIATFYQKNIETPFFNHYLKNKNLQLIFLKLICLILEKRVETICRMATKSSSKNSVLFKRNGQFTTESPSSASFTEYFSDPNKPVPSSTNLKDFNGFTPRNYMSEDQRFTENRPDVASFTTEILRRYYFGWRN
jgi:predicted acyl esterase